MHPLAARYRARTLPQRVYHAEQSGFSLIEVLLIITMLSAMILPFTLLMSQTADNARGAYLQSSRSIVLNSIMDQVTADRNTFVSAYNTSMNSEVTESGQIIPFRRMPDSQNAGAMDIFKKTVYYYLYNKTSDAANAPRYKTKQVLNRNVFRVRFDQSQFGFTDASGIWWGCYNGYDAPNLVPGVNSVYAAAYDTTDMINLPGNTDTELYEREWYSPTDDILYEAPVSTGLYTVKLYFKEIDQPGRLLDIYLENQLMNPDRPFNAYYACDKKYYCANVQMFDVYVSDGSLSIKIGINAAATHSYRNLSAISIKKRT
jgi:Tfp pilus assembly protein PilV